MFGKEYSPGQHVTILGPSGRGKTKVAGQMLLTVIRKHPNLYTVYMLHGKIKGRDQTIVKLADAAHMQIIREGEPNWWQRYRRKYWRKYKTGYVIRPLDKPGESIRAENATLSREFGRTLHRGYHANRKHPVILIVDEAHQTQVELKLKTECEGPLMRGRPDCGEWSLLQRGRFASQHVYDEAEWVLIFFDPDKTNQERYSEIGGVDPQFLKYLSTQLETHTAPDGSTYSQFILFRRSGDYLAIVDV